MKKLLIAYLLLVSSVAVGEFVYDEKTNAYSSKGASRDVDQAEFNEICYIFVRSCYPRGILDLTTHELALFFAGLRIKGTPAALRFIHDAKEMIKIARADFRSLENL